MLSRNVVQVMVIGNGQTLYKNVYISGNRSVYMYITSL